MLTAPPADLAPPQRHPAAAAPGEQIGSHYDGCFGCGESHPYGLRVRRTAGEGVRLTAEIRIAPEHQGAPGLAHGGLICAMVDEALGGLLHLLWVPAVTARLETDFVAPVPVGQPLHLDAQCLGTVGRKIYSQAVGRLGGPDGRIAVRASALFLAVPLSHFVEHSHSVDPGTLPEPDDMTYSP